MPTGPVPAPAPSADPDPFELPGGPRGVLLLHGFTGTPFELRALGERLAAEGYRVSAPLLPGHGLTPAAMQATGPADWLAGAARGLDGLRARCERVAVVGLSLGSLLAIELAASRPADVAAVGLLATPYWPAPRLAALLLLYGFTPAARLWPEFPKPAGHDEVLDPAQKGRNPAYPVLPMLAGRKLRGHIRRVRGLVPRVRCPALVIHGQQDRLVLPAGARRLARRLGSARVWQRYLPGSAHLVTLDRERAALEDCVAAFLGEVM
ncbi:MAG TPA: alpha/beta fold hydrolase [Myxococcota bacterium]|nr:alpha/beta fold hydrolase [Myxococcota bacterium]HRY96689.1 alpha/beta fold hydrolase [Myxococcota bacterium]